MKKLYVILLVLLFSCSLKAQSFVKEIAASNGPGTSIGLYCNLAIGSDNVVHISHYDYVNKDLLYTTNATGQWVTTIIDSAGQVGEYNSIAVDGNNKAHISYYEWIRNDSIGGSTVPYGNLKYATNKSGQWQTARIDTGAGLLTRICVDKQNYIHIIHTQLGVANLTNLLNIKYTTNKSGTWQSIAVAPGVVKGADGSIAIDKNFKIHMAVRNEEGVGTSPNGGMGGLRYITNSTGSWTWFNVDTNFNAGNDVDIAVDTACNAHISYLDKTKGLKYATNQSGSWTYVVVDTTSNVGWNTSIAIDKNNKIHISYSDPSTLLQPPGHGYLKYAFNNGSGWNISIVDSVNAGLYTCIALDTNRLPHISYTAIEQGIGILRHAYQSPVTGISENNYDKNDFIIFPNPATFSTTIKFSLQNAEQINLKIFDITGKEIFVLKNEKMQKGEHAVSLDTHELQSELYFLQLITEHNIRTEKMEIIK